MGKSQKNRQTGSNHRSSHVKFIRNGWIKAKRVVFKLQSKLTRRQLFIVSIFMHYNYCAMRQGGNQVTFQFFHKK